MCSRWSQSYYLFIYFYILSIRLCGLDQAFADRFSLLLLLLMYFFSFHGHLRLWPYTFSQKVNWSKHWVLVIIEKNMVQIKLCFQWLMHSFLFMCSLWVNLTISVVSIIASLPLEQFLMISPSCFTCLIRLQCINESF